MKAQTGRGKPRPHPGADDAEFLANAPAAIVTWCEDVSGGAWKKPNGFFLDTFPHQMLKARDFARATIAYPGTAAIRGAIKTIKAQLPGLISEIETANHPSARLPKNRALNDLAGRLDELLQSAEGLPHFLSPQPELPIPTRPWGPAAAILMYDLELWLPTVGAKFSGFTKEDSDQVRFLSLVIGYCGWPSATPSAIAMVARNRGRNANRHPENGG